MSDELDRFSKALASGTSRRTALAGLVAGAVAAAPWTTEGKNRRKKRNKRFKQYQELCKQWCGEKFGFGSGQFTACVNAAKEGKGVCYSAEQEGPGFYCLHKAGCGKNQICCPAILGGQPVKDAECCGQGSRCNGAVNGTGICL